MHPGMAPHLQQLQEHLLRASSGRYQPLLPPLHHAGAFSLPPHPLAAHLAAHKAEQVRVSNQSASSSTSPSIALIVVTSFVIWWNKVTDTVLRLQMQMDRKLDSPPVVSSVTAEADTSASGSTPRKAHRIKRESGSGMGLGAMALTHPKNNPSPGAMECQDEPADDFIETHCHWRECTVGEFPTQDDLVKVSALQPLCLLD